MLESVTVDAADTVRVVEDEVLDDVAQADLEAGPVVKLTNLILKDAVDQRATDIHLQPASGGGTVRFRIDGVLRPYMNMPRAALNRVISRIKIVGKMDISDRLRPQDGRARIAIGPNVYDLRISSVPTRRAEEIDIPGFLRLASLAR